MEVLHEFEKKEDAYLLRSNYTGDKIYLVQDETKYWLKNPETLEKLGFTFGQEKSAEFSDLAKLKDGGIIDLTKRQSEVIAVEKHVTVKPVLSYRKTA